ncbi:hypothetical protein SUGI_0312390 [Cryptomeria japonica]|nr:hypothetical protein SUGI_0312390 [Cryptomeria japonica]
MGKALNASVLLLLLSVVFLSGLQVGDAELCNKRFSSSFDGSCFISSNCEFDCQFYENAETGQCHWSSRGSACFCYDLC